MAFGDGLAVKQVGCKVCAYLDSLDREERVRVEGFIADDDYSDRGIAAEIGRETSSEITKDSVRRHRVNHMGMRA